MKYICIDTSGAKISVCARDENGSTAFLSDDGTQRAARALMPMLNTALLKAAFTINEAEFVGVVVGPGSFTGERIGVVTARTLSFALKIPIVPVNSCFLAAYNGRTAMKAAGKKKCLTFSDAGNGYLYAACYDGNGTELMPPSCVDMPTVKNLISENTDAFVVADKKYAQTLGALEADGEGLCELCLEMFPKFAVSFDKVEPLYVRKSQAELSQ